MSAYNGIHLRAMVTAEFLTLAELLDDMEEASWNTLSLCAGWRVREVVAHLTMPVRYSPAQFHAELQDCRGDFTQLSNRIASRDAMLPTGTLVDSLRDGVHLRTNDMAWRFGSGHTISGAAEHLALLLCGRALAPQTRRGASSSSTPPRRPGVHPIGSTAMQRSAPTRSAPRARPRGVHHNGEDTCEWYLGGVYRRTDHTP